MPNYILKELNGELTDGRKVVFPKMQTYSLPDSPVTAKGSASHKVWVRRE